ncbi:MAG: GDP-L-fucose synthase, partial [Acidobacteria bacterium]|nr:GDP-L-fucose synthase [Acidobacteriota bacterium]
RDAKVFVAGHRGMVGSAIVRELQAKGYTNLVVRTAAELDLRNQAAVVEFFERETPSHVVLAAAKVGGIRANNIYRAEFLYDNLAIEMNVIEQSYRNGVEKLLFLGSSCIYPKLASQPMVEEALLTGALEPTNEPYAIAKIAGLKLCEAYWDQYGAHFISAMPTNLYGPNDNYDLDNSHVLPALLRKFHEAKNAGAESVEIWGDGSALREFMHVDDLAAACVFLLESYDEKQFVNIGTGEEVSIGALALTIKDVVGFAGELVFDTSKPNGTPRKLMDSSKLHALGFNSKVSLRDGIESVYSDFVDQIERYTR